MTDTDSGSTIFSWQVDEMDALLATCDGDEISSLIRRFFSNRGRTLESGCGAGRYVRYLTDRGFPIEGLEFSATTIRMVRSKWPDLKITQGNCASSPFPDKSFDQILSLGVVEHFPDGMDIPLADIFRLLRPGGLAIISVPCMSLVRRVKLFLFWNELVGLPRAVLKLLLRRKSVKLNRFKRQNLFTVFPTYGDFYEYRLTPKEFETQLVKAGFLILEHQPTAIIDGLYHELNFLGLLIAWRDTRFFPTRAAIFINSTLAKLPFFHSHMQAVVVQRPSDLHHQSLSKI